jgi:hypothetical protein
MIAAARFGILTLLVMSRRQNDEVDCSGAGRRNHGAAGARGGAEV